MVTPKAITSSARKIENSIARETTARLNLAIFNTATLLWLQHNNNIILLLVICKGSEEACNSLIHREIQRGQELYCPLLFITNESKARDRTYVRRAKVSFIKINF